MSVPFAQHPCQTLALLGFLFLANLVGVKWNPIVVWTYISLMTNEAEHLFEGFSGHLLPLFGNSPSSFGSPMSQAHSFSAV